MSSLPKALLKKGSIKWTRILPFLTATLFFTFVKVTDSKAAATAKLQVQDHEIQGKLIFSFDSSQPDENIVRWSWEFNLAAGDGYKGDSVTGDMSTNTSNLHILIESALQSSVAMLNGALSEAESHRLEQQARAAAESEQMQRLWGALKGRASD